MPRSSRSLVLALGIAGSPRDARAWKWHERLPAESTGEVQSVQAAPAGCVTSVSVRVPFSACQVGSWAPGSSYMQVLRGIEATHTMALNPAFTNVGGKLVTSAAVEGECWLECGDQPEVAVWRYELTTTGWTGRVACTTPGQTAVAVDLVATETPLNPAILLLWRQARPNGESARMHDIFGDQFAEDCAAGQPGGGRPSPPDIDIDTVPVPAAGPR